MNQTIFNTIIDTLQNVSFIIAAVLFIQVFHNSDVKLTRKKFIAVTVMSTALYTINCIWELQGHEYLNWIVAVSYLTLPIIGLWKRKMNASYFLINYFRLLFANFFITLLCFFISYALIVYIDLGVYSRFNIESVMMCILVTIFNVCMYFLFVKNGIEARLSFFDKLLIFAYFILIFYIDTADFDLLLTLSDNFNVSVAKEIFVFVMIIILPALIFKNMQSKYYNELSVRNERFLEAELVASNMYREAQEDTRAFRHDMNNNLIVISALMKEKKYSEAEEYINELHERISSLSPRIVTGDEMLDSLISSKLSEIDRKNIKIAVKGIIDGGLKWKAIDTCAVFANLIDNAMEACEQIENINNRYINLQFRKTDYQRLIIVTNSVGKAVDCRELEENVHYTSKTDKKNHGYGLYNIRRTLDKYGAIMKIECSESEFKISIVTTR